MDQPLEAHSDWLESTYKIQCQECGDLATVVYWYNPEVIHSDEDIGGGNIWEWKGRSFYCLPCAEGLNILPDEPSP